MPADRRVWPDAASTTATASSPTATPARWPPPSTAPRWPPFYLGRERGMNFRVYTATRPGPCSRARGSPPLRCRPAGVDTTADLRQHGLHRHEERLGQRRVRGLRPRGRQRRRLPTRSAPPAWRFWPSTTASPSMCWAPPPPSTCRLPDGEDITDRAASRRGR